MTKRRYGRSVCETSVAGSVRHSRRYSGGSPQKLRELHLLQNCQPGFVQTALKTACNSNLGCLTEKRTLGQGWRIRGRGRNSSASFVIRVHSTLALWLRRHNCRCQRTSTWYRNALSAIAAEQRPKHVRWSKVDILVPVAGHNSRPPNAL